MTLSDAAAALRARQVSSVELVTEAFARADELDPQLGVYLERFDDGALAAARAADQELSKGIDRGALHGIPLGVKDLLAMAEGPTTANSVVLDRAWGDGRDAIVIERLKAAGAAILGKVTTMEFAVGLHDPKMPFPRPRNPWNLDCWPGGSSCGTGAGVAAGFFLAGIGTDTGGSIRIPAACCGVSGLMPTYGRVPTAGCVPLSWSLDHIGPLARSARDCAALLDAIVGDDPRDPYAINAPSAAAPPDSAKAGQLLRGLRIGVERSNHFGADGEDPALAPAFAAAIEVLRDLGADVRDVVIPHYAETVTAQFVTMVSEAFAYHRESMREQYDDYFPATRLTLGAGALFSGADYVQAQRVRRIAQRSLATLLKDVDLIATPTVATGAWTYEALEANGMRQMMRTAFTSYWDAVGNPALAVPMGFSGDGMPLSLQLGGSPFGEALLVRVGEAFQAETDFHLRIPPIAASPPAADPSVSTNPSLRTDRPCRPGVDTHVAAMLSAADLPLNSADSAHFTALHESSRRDIDALYSLPEARYEAPSLVFHAAPNLENWMLEKHDNH